MPNFNIYTLFTLKYPCRIKVTEECDTIIGSIF